MKSTAAVDAYTSAFWTVFISSWSWTSTFWPQSLISLCVFPTL